VALADFVGQWFIVVAGRLHCYQRRGVVGCHLLHLRQKVANISLANIAPPYRPPANAGIVLPDAPIAAGGIMAT
jgi:hypothetical protein